MSRATGVQIPADASSPEHNTCERLLCRWLSTRGCDRPVGFESKAGTRSSATSRATVVRIPADGARLVPVGVVDVHTVGCVSVGFSGHVSVERRNRQHVGPRSRRVRESHTARRRAEPSRPKSGRPEYGRQGGRDRSTWPSSRAQPAKAWLCCQPYAVPTRRKPGSRRTTIRPVGR